MYKLKYLLLIVVIFLSCSNNYSEKQRISIFFQSLSLEFKKKNYNILFKDYFSKDFQTNIGNFSREKLSALYIINKDEFNLELVRFRSDKDAFEEYFTSFADDVNNNENGIFFHCSFTNIEFKYPNDIYKVMNYCGELRYLIELIIENDKLKLKSFGNYDLIKSPIDINKEKDVLRCSKEYLDYIDDFDELMQSGEYKKVKDLLTEYKNKYFTDVKIIKANTCEYVNLLMDLHSVCILMRLGNECNDIFESIKKYGDTREYYVEGIEKAYYNASVLNMNMRNFQIAYECIQKAITFNPDDEEYIKQKDYVSMWAGKH